jgi:hypothetical protein
VTTASLPAALAALALAACGCGQVTAASPAPATVTAHGRGLTVELPANWQRAPDSLTPGLFDPREVLSVGTFPLRYRQMGCNHMPSSALADLGPRDAFLTLQERGTNPGSDWEGFAPRPQHFGPRSRDDSEASECVPDSHFTDHWIWFSDGGRHFHVLVAFGPEAPGEVRDQAWRILDSLRIDPGARPDWSSAP